jgi:hypothetical protein
MFTSLLVGGFLVISVAAASGQSPDPAADALFHVGPLAFTPAISVPTLGIDSNVFNENENPRQAFTADIQPEVEAWLRVGQLRVGAREQLNLLYFHDYPSEGGVNTNTNLKADLLLLWGTPHASVSFVQTNNRPDARIDTRAVAHRRPTTVGIDFRLSSSTNIDVGADFDNVSYDEDATFDGESLQTALDRNTRNYHAILRYAVTPPTTIKLTVARQEERFRYSPEQDSESLRVVPGIAFAADSVITGGMEVGWISFKPETATRLRHYTGIVAKGDLGYVFFGLTQFQFSVNRDLAPSIDSISSYALQTALTGTVTHRVTERWDVNVSATHLRLDLGEVRSLIDADTSFARADTVKTYAAGIGLHFNRGLRLGLRVESINRTSAVPSNSYDNLRILSSINYDLK